MSIKKSLEVDNVLIIKDYDQNRELCEVVEILNSEICKDLVTKNYVIESPLFSRMYPWLEEMIQNRTVKIVIGEADYYMVEIEYEQDYDLVGSAMRRKKNVAILQPGDCIIKVSDGSVAVRIENSNHLKKENVREI